MLSYSRSGQINFAFAISKSAPCQRIKQVDICLSDCHHIVFQESIFEIYPVTHYA